MPHSFGKCTLLYIEGMKNFVSYLQISPLQTEVVPFEIKGVFVSDCQIKLKMETKVFCWNTRGKEKGTECQTSVWRNQKGRWSWRTWTKKACKTVEKWDNPCKKEWKNMTGIYDSHPLRILWFQNMLMELETSCCGMKYSLLTETQSKHQKQGQQSQNTRGMDGDS